MRKERDFIGEIDIEDNKYYGVNTQRAINNFSIDYKMVNIEVIRAMALIKKAAAIANNKVGKLSVEKSNLIIKACERIYSGEFDSQFTLPGLQGGAGTSINMNINEVIANIALEEMGAEKGEYEKIHPLDDVNMSQSTNDIYPTSVKMVVIKLLRELVVEIMELQNGLQAKEKEFADVYKIGRTQLKDAIPITLGQEFGAYAEAVSRDRWRLYKAEERIRVINLGGTAIGTGVGAPLKYRYYVIDELRKMTGYGLAKADNLIENTQNMDSFVEVSGLLKTLMVNMNKIANDLRLMDSGPNSGIAEIRLQPLQAGSTIMAGKINPVGPEFIKQIYYRVTANDLVVSMAAADGEFELNAMLPIIADAIIESLIIIRDGVKFFNEKVIKGLEANRDKCREHLEKSWSVATLYIEKLGYEKLTEVIKEAIMTGKDYKEILVKHGIEV